MATFTDLPSYIVDNEDVKAAIANRPLQQLQDNCLWLKDRLNTVVDSTALFLRSAPVLGTALVGQPVYWNTSNARYELAIADGTTKQNVVGFVHSKQSATIADIAVEGSVVMPLLDATGGVTPVAGRYYLSTTVAGRITTSRPSPSVLLGFYDGASRFTVQLQVADLVATGVQNDALAGTSANGQADASVSGDAANPLARVLGVLLLKNTGTANAVDVRVTATDAAGAVATSAPVTVPFGANFQFKLDADVDVLKAPYRQVKLVVNSTVADSHSPFTVWRYVLFNPPPG
jgi:hypothetical protein